MKKVSYLLLVISLIISSCSENNDLLESTSTLKKKAIVTENQVSSPVSAEIHIPPYVIPGDNNGGNRTCAEVAAAFNTSFDYCGDKIDYDGDFMGSFPEGLIISTDGTYVSFDVSGCIEIEGEYYKVGAVVVKGSDNANVYYYPDGAWSDSGLASPENRSGKPAGLSNLTFCFVKCDIGVAIKLWYYDYLGNYRHAISEGEVVFDSGWCSDLGISKTYMEGSIQLIREGVVVGEVDIKLEHGVFNFIVMMYDDAHLDWGGVFIGSKELLVDSTTGECPAYWTDPWHKFIDSSFSVPLN